VSHEFTFNKEKILRFTRGIYAAPELLSPIADSRPSRKSKLCYDGWSIGQSVLVANTHLGSETKFVLCCGFADVGRPL
jgi:hypothetical protein